MNNKNKITKATFSLSLKRGFDNVSISQIKKEAEVTTGAIYYHFNDKDDILLEIINVYLLDPLENFIELISNMKKPIYEKLKFIFYYIIGYDIEKENVGIEFHEDLSSNYKEYHLLFEGIYHQHPEIRKQFQDVNTELFNLYKKTIDDAIEKNEIRSDINSEETALAIFASLYGFANIWGGIPKYNIDQIIDANVNMIYGSIKK
jgi:AcrR family transcriptional regulator